MEPRRVLGATSRTAEGMQRGTQIEGTGMAPDAMYSLEEDRQYIEETMKMVRPKFPRLPETAPSAKPVR